MMKRIVFLFSVLFGYSLASYCGQSAIPFSFEVGQDGQPILGCARPTCFGWTANGKRAADTAQFYKINKKPDGFLRTTDTRGPVVANASAFRPQFSVCERTYMWNQCFGVNQWVGGIAPLSAITNDTLFQVLCCTYDGLKDAKDQGLATVLPGQAVVGGEIKGEDGRQYSFEYISNVQRNFDDSGKVSYQVSMKRFPCLPDPIYQEAGVESGTTDMLVQNIQKEKNPVEFAAKTVGVEKPVQAFAQTQFDVPKALGSETVIPGPGSVASNSPAKALVELPNQQAAPAQAPKTEYKTLPDGRVVPCTDPQQGTPVAIPQDQPGTAPVAQPQPQLQTQNVNYFQPNLLDPFGLFSRPLYAQQPAQTYGTVQAPSQPAAAPNPYTTFGSAPQSPTAPVASPNPYPTIGAAPQSPVAQATAPNPYPTIGSVPQSVPQPTYAYNPFWPFYTYSQNPAVSYGVQTQVAAQPQLAPQQLPQLIPQPQAQLIQNFQANSPRALAAAPHPKPVPLKIPSMEEIENSIPESGRKMIATVAKTLLQL